MDKYIFLAIMLLIFSLSVVEAKTVPWNEDGRYRAAFVINPALAALRREPTPTSLCLRRLRIGRRLYLISAQQHAGIRYYYVALTRRTRGYIDAAAIASAKQKGDDVRLMRVINTATGIEQLQLAQLLTKEFAHSPLCAEALLVEGREAEKAAVELSQKFIRRSPAVWDAEVEMLRYWLNYSGLDRYSRLGINFRIDEENQRFYYDGAAYRRILQRYPRSPAALTARERLQALTEVSTFDHPNGAQTRDLF